MCLFSRDRADNVVVFCLSFALSKRSRVACVHTQVINWSGASDCDDFSDSESEEVEGHCEILSSLHHFESENLIRTKRKHKIFNQLIVLAIFDCLAEMTTGYFFDL